MLTRIEIDGFKTFRDFTLDVPPFLVVLGRNGGSWILPTGSTLIQAASCLVRRDARETVRLDPDGPLAEAA